MRITRGVQSSEKNKSDIGSRRVVVFKSAHPPKPYLYYWACQRVQQQVMIHSKCHFAHPNVKNKVKD